MMKITISHGHIFDGKARSGHGLNSRRLHITVIKESAITMKTIPVTTAEVAASPTAEALRPHCMPRIQPESAISTPNTAHLTIQSKNPVYERHLQCDPDIAPAIRRKSSLSPAHRDYAHQIGIKTKQRHN